MSDPAPHRRWPGAGFWIACAGVAAWFGVLQVFKPDPIADEREHWPVICELARGQWPSPGRISTLPTFHLLAAGAVRLLGESLWVARGLSALATVGAWWFLHGAAQIRHGPGASRHVLLAAASPVYFPYCALAYTEPLTMLAAAAALWAHVRRRYALAAVAMLAACLVRQSMIAWLAFFAVWSALDARHATPAAARRRGATIRVAWPYAVAFSLFAAFLLRHRAWAWSPHEQTRVGVNIAQFYLFALVVAAVGAPVWLQTARALWRPRIGPLLARGAPCVILVTAVMVVALGYRNPHPWNWSENYLHDRLLGWIEVNVFGRAIVAIVVTFAVPLIVEFVRRQPDRGVVMAAWVFAVVYLLPHWLVDHRYSIFPLFFISFCTNFAHGEARAMASWNAMLSAGAVGYVVAFGGANSGL